MDRGRAVDLLQCPRCRGELAQDHESFACESCGHDYPVRFGIPDLRVFPDPYISTDDEVVKTARLFEFSRQATFEETVRLYWQLTPGVAQDQVERYIDYACRGVARGRAILDVGRTEAHRTSATCLDLGCGTGGMMAAAADRFDRVIGVDIALRWLIVARKRLEELGRPAVLICACAEALPFKPGSIDAVYSVDLLEHSSEPGRILSETRRVLSGGGTYTFVSPNRYSLGPEPCVRLWGVGFVPRRFAATYVRWMKGIPYENIALLSSWEMRRQADRAGLLGARLSPATIAASDRATLPKPLRPIATLYNALTRVPVIRSLLRACGPIVRIDGQVDVGAKVAARAEQTSDHRQTAAPKTSTALSVAVAAALAASLLVAGPLVEAGRAVAGEAVAIAVDDFERPSLGTSWSVFNGDPGIVNGSDLGMRSRTSKLRGLGILSWNATSFAADQFSEAVLSSAHDGTVYQQVFVRRRLSDGARYGFHWAPDGGGRWELKLDGIPTGIDLITVPSPGPAPGDVVRLEARGTELRGYHNGALVISATEDTLKEPGEPGVAINIRYVEDERLPIAALARWRAGSLVNPVTTTPSPPSTASSTQTSTAVPMATDTGTPVATNAPPTPVGATSTPVTPTVTQTRIPPSSTIASSTRTSTAVPMATDTETPVATNAPPTPVGATSTPVTPTVTQTRIPPSSTIAATPTSPGASPTAADATMTPVLLADVDLDGRITAADLDLLLEAVFAAFAPAPSDVNRDGATNAADVTAWLEEAAG